MAELDIAEEGIAIVLRGRFNPAIVSPAWLLAQELITAEDAVAVRPELMVPQMSFYDLPWGRVEATDDRFMVRTKEPEQYERARDLVLGVFSVLSHTPTNGLGINRWHHVRMPGVDEWHALGDALVPKGPWEQCLTYPGLSGLAIQSMRANNLGGRVLVRFESSNVYPLAVFVEQNDHYNLETDVEPPTSRNDAAVPPKTLDPSAELLAVALRLLNDQWSDSIARADALMETIIGSGGA